MENQDKINELFKLASEQSESKNFDSKESIWNRVEGKLDHVIIKKQSQIWKKIAVAATVLLVTSAGYQLLQLDENINLPAQKIVNNTTTTPKSNSKIAVAEKPEIFKNAAIDYAKVEEIVSKTDDKTINKVGFLEKTCVATDKTAEKADQFGDSNLSTKKESHFVKGRIYNAVAVKSTPSAAVNDELENAPNYQEELKQTEPLYVIDAVAMTKDKAKKFNDTHFDNEFEKIVELKEPLYIINGTYYSEEELFGANHTSPYYPLNKQEIETISILQSDVATPIYGKKGEKGVVIIRTKNGKPAVISKKE